MLDLVIVNVPYMFINNPPLAGAVLKSCVEEQGFNAKSMDYNIDFVNHPVATNDIVLWLQKEDSPPQAENYINFKNWVKECAKEILSQQARWIGISIFTKDSQLACEEFVVALKDLDPNCQIVLGGMGQEDRRNQWGARWIDLMWNSGIVDSVIAREAEKEVVELLKHDKKEFVQAPQLTVEELDNLPVPNFDDYNLDLYGDLDPYSTEETISMPITGSKGCVRKCTFCNVASFWPKYRQRNGHNIGKEIIDLYNKYGINYFKFTDSLINGSLKDFRLMNEYITDRMPNTISYKGQFICRPARHMPDRDYDLMRSAGCKLVQIGMESGSEAVRDHMGKKFTNSDIERTTYSLADQKIRQQWFIFVGYPTETDADFEETLAMVEKFGHLGKQNLLNIIPTGTYMTLDNTPITSPEMMHDLGIYMDDNKAWQTYHWASTKYPDNTFEVRADRFERLVNLCKKLGVITEFENTVDKHLVIIKSALSENVQVA